MKDESRLIFILSIRFALVMMVLSFLLRLAFFKDIVGLVVTPLLVGGSWFLVSLILLKLVKGSSEEIFALLIPKSSDNEMGDSSELDQVFSNEEMDKHDEDEVGYENLFDTSNSETIQEDIDAKEKEKEKENNLLKHPKKKSGEMSADDFKENDPKDMARVVRSMLNKD